MVSALVSYFGLSNLSLAEDIVQDTFLTAFNKWTNEGMPDNPESWLFRVCKNKAINELQKPVTRVRHVKPFNEEQAIDPKLEHLFMDYEIKDNQLRLLFACCHPSLAPKAQLILILRNLCGLKVSEIANALAMTDEAVIKTITRSKNMLRDGNVSLYVPYLTRSKERLIVVHTSIYLMFSEGYSASQGEEVIRHELCLEAMRLIKTILDIPTIRNHDTYALMSLMCFHTARFKSRLDPAGEIIELEQQDRLQWDGQLITLGIHYFKSAQASKLSTRFILEAAIASVHSMSNSFDKTDWKLILKLYDKLILLQHSPFVELNRAVAVLYAEGGVHALSALENAMHLNWLKHYYLYYALLGKIYSLLNKTDKAILHYEKALSLTKLRAEQFFLKNKLEALVNTK